MWVRGLRSASVGAKRVPLARSTPPRVLSNVERRGKESMDLMEIKGKVNTAICYARVVEDEAIEQIRRMCDYAMTEGSRIRIMPDVHAGNRI